MTEKKEKRYLSDNAQLMAEWNMEKNNELKLFPETLTLGSNKKAWWKCRKGHEWQALICSRNDGRGCPYCSGRYIVKGENDLQTVNPTLAQEWNYEKNNGLTPVDVMPNSNKKVWWKCSKGHEWQAAIVDRNQGTNCPYCSSKKVLRGYNDLQTVNPILAQEWNYKKNNGLTPVDVMPNSNKKVWWKCKKDHEWQATIVDRNQGRGCPYCSNKKVLRGYNDLQTVNPTLAQEWNYEKNNGLTPKDVIPNSDKKVWWKCPKGHEWQTMIIVRNQGANCPYCSSKKVFQGYNDLQTVNPTLAQEWNYEKNNGLTPADVMPNSNKKVWWKCSKGHEWKATIDSRNKGNRCPYCTGLYVIRGYNDLQTVNPTLAQEWNYEKNNGLTPVDVMSNSHKKVWWKCQKGHEWQARIADRNNGHGCHVCSSERSTSFPEYALVYYLKQSSLDVIHSYKKQGYELDVYIPSKKIAIEYDGQYWHENKTEKDLEKNQKCVKDGIKLYRIREGLSSLNDSSVDYVVQENQKDLAKTLQELLKEIVGISIDVDLERDNIVIENLREHTEKEGSLLLSNPQIAHEWNFGKNGNLMPENFFANSQKKVWWKCRKGHEWEASIASRNNGNGCPYCSGLYVTKGENDLETVNPTLAREWNYEKNGDLTPTDVMPNSGKKVWWKCQKGHEWQARITERNKGTRCPYCGGRYVIKGENDLETVNPTLAKEWNYEKNNGLTPADVMPNSNKKVWWKCSRGHEWQTTIIARNQGTNCPYCSGKKVLQGYNDLQSVNSAVVKEWNYEKNNGLTPADVMPNSNKKVWWKCSRGHEWQARVADRNKGSRCPICVKEKLN